MGRLLKAEELAAQFSVSRSTIYRWFWEGKLNGLQLTDNGAVRFRPEDVEEYRRRARRP